METSGNLVRRSSDLSHANLAPRHPLDAASAAGELVHDWNPRDGVPPGVAPQILDQTLRDGLQSPSVRYPTLEAKLELILNMTKIGVAAVDVGLPSSSRRTADDAVALIRAIAQNGWPIEPLCSARATREDVETLLQVAHRAGRPPWAYLFWATSRVRSVSESWCQTELQTRAVDAVAHAARRGLSVAFVAEDASRTDPETLRTIVSQVLDAGASRICLCDTTGALRPEGARHLVLFAHSVLTELGLAQVGLDWHGHDDRGLALSTALAAAEAGATRLHATALGEGERAGNTSVEELVVNGVLDGRIDACALRHLSAYSQAAARALGVAVPRKFPAVGPDAFRTASGVHAAAIVKALALGDPSLIDQVYSAVPARLLGRKQEICVGFMSGRANIRYWLGQQGLPEDEGLVGELLELAKTSQQILSDDQLLACIQRYRDAQKANGVHHLDPTGSGQ